MREAQILALAGQLLSGQISPEELARRLVEFGQATGPLAPAPAPATAHLGDAELDLDRQRRCGYPEVVFGEGKSAESLVRIVRTMAETGIDVLATRIDAEKARALCERFPGAVYNPLARTWRLPEPPRADRPAGQVAVISAGTSDRPVAEEAAETARWMGAQVEMIQDVGVAGPHRLPAALPRFVAADAVVVVAGMEAALPSVVGGYVACPVIGVPTSVGYGANFDGLTALLGMLVSCAANVTVVNIDAGFKGGYLAGLIAGNLARARGTTVGQSQQSGQRLGKPS